MQLADGRWMLARERRTSDGGTVVIRSDITHLKQREEIRLREVERRRRLAEAERLAAALRESEAISGGVTDTRRAAYGRRAQDDRIPPCKLARGKGRRRVGGSEYTQVGVAST